MIAPTPIELARPGWFAEQMAASQMFYQVCNGLPTQDIISDTKDSDCPTRPTVPRLAQFSVQQLSKPQPDKCPDTLRLGPV
jgi:hypothetical protein